MRYPMSIKLETALDGLDCFEAVNTIILELDGEDSTESLPYGNYFLIKAYYPHRKARMLEESVAAALATLPVKRTTVYTKNPTTPSRRQVREMMSMM